MLQQSFGRKLRNFSGLSVSLAKAQFKMRNEGTLLGVFWYLLGPVLMFLLLLGIFQDRLGYAIPNYPLYLLLGIIMFNLFQSITTETVKIFRTNYGIIRAINFPKECLVGAAVLKTLFSHVFEILVLGIFLVFFGLSFETLVFYPLVLVFLLVFAFGSGLILSSIGTYLFDLENVWKFAVRLIWFGTPIFYAIGGQGKLFTLNLFNPMFYFISVARDLIIYSRMPETWMLMGMIGYTALFLIVGLFIFGKLKGRFAELV